MLDFADSCLIRTPSRSFSLIEPIVSLTKIATGRPAFSLTNGKFEVSTMQAFTFAPILLFLTMCPNTSAQLTATPPPDSLFPGSLPPIGSLTELCGEATALLLDATVEGSFAGNEGPWYTVVGTGGYLAASSCTGDSSLDNTTLDTVINVFSGNCDTLTLEASDDDGGSCGNAKSTVYFPTVTGETYYVNVNPYIWTTDLADIAFGLTLFEVDVPPNTVCENAVPVQLGEIVEGETSAIGNGAWYSIAGTGDDLVITTCTGTSLLDNAVFDSVITVYARDCDDLRFITSDDEGGKCGNGKSAVILASVEGLTYHINIYEYSGSTGSFGLKVSASAP